MSYILERLKRYDTPPSLYIVRTPNGFGQSTYNIVSTNDKIHEFYNRFGEGYGLTKSEVIGPLQVNQWDMNFCDHDTLRDFLYKNK